MVAPKHLGAADSRRHKVIVTSDRTVVLEGFNRRKTLANRLRRKIRLRTRLFSVRKRIKIQYQKSAAKMRMAIAPRKHIFVSSGGMGSSFLIRSIRTQGRTPCIGKPFVNAFFFADYPEKVTRLYPNRPVVANASVPTSRDVCESFLRVQEQESDFSLRYAFREGIPIDENLQGYLDFLQKNRLTCVLRATSCHDLLQRMQIKGVVFFIRHPLQSYISYTKPIRHKPDIDSLGGVEAEEALQFWAWSWQAVANTYLACKKAGLKPVLLRYEYLQEDLQQAGSYRLNRIFSGFSYRHNSSTLPLQAEQRLRALVGSSYTQLYGDWHLPHDSENAQG